MSTGFETISNTDQIANSQIRHRCDVRLNDESLIPEWICDLASFRKWEDSEDDPTHGRYSFLNGQLGVDLTLEQPFSHNLLKTKLTACLNQFVDSKGMGYVFSDGVRLSHPTMVYSTEPDVVFASYDAIRRGDVELIEGVQGGYVELEGSPELVVEIVSRSSVKKDTVVLRDLYAQSGIREYWLIDARSTVPVFELLALQNGLYESAKVSDEGRYSAVLSKYVILTSDLDPLGHPKFGLQLNS